MDMRLRHDSEIDIYSSRGVIKKIYIFQKILKASRGVKFLQKYKGKMRGYKQKFSGINNLINIHKFHVLYRNTLQI